jgi:hypothetical protein
MKKLLLVILLLVMACGDGENIVGPSNNTPTPTTIAPSTKYSGLWDFTVTSVEGKCSVNTDRMLTGYLYVTHTGTKVSLRNINLTLIGTTNSKDGFDVVSPTISFGEECSGQSEIRFEDASDGEALASHTVLVACNPAAWTKFVPYICSVKYSGKAIKMSRHEDNPEI